MKKKAVSEADREQRKNDIRSAAAALFRSHDFDGIRMIDIAEQAGLAKGTLFIYFATKEEIFLELLMAEYQTWFTGMKTLLSVPLREPDWKSAIVNHISRSVEDQATLFRLVSILHSVLERNIGLEAAVRFKKFLSTHLRETGAMVEAVLPALKPGDGARLFVQLHALIVGFSSIALPSPVLRKAIEQENLGEFRVDFGASFVEAVRIFFRGL